MCVFELSISHILPGRTCRKSTENWRERGADQRVIGRHNANWLISLVKVYVHTCVRSICVPTLSGGIQSGKSLQKIWGFDFATKISESEKGNYSWQTYLSYIVWPLKYVSIPLFDVLTSISCSIQPFITHHLNFLPSLLPRFLSSLCAWNPCLLVYHNETKISMDIKIAL